MNLDNFMIGLLFIYYFITKIENINSLRCIEKIFNKREKRLFNQNSSLNV